MSSGFSGGAPDFLTGGGRAINQQFNFRSPLSGVLPDSSAQIRRPDFMGKRSLAEFQQQNQLGLGFYPRNIRFRPNFYPVSSISNSTYGNPILHQNRLVSMNDFDGNVQNGSVDILLPNFIGKGGNENNGTNINEKTMMDHRLQELEKELLGDGDEDGGEAVSELTNNEWSDTFQNLINPTQKANSLSPTSSSSSCSSTFASPPPSTKQSLIDAASAISGENSAAAVEIIARLQQVSNPIGTSEQRFTAHMVSALKSRINPIENPPPVAELYGKEHLLSTQMLYDVSPCFKLGFMAANLAILEATAEQELHKIHVVDFDIGEGAQYMHFLHALLARNSSAKRAAALKITAFTDFTSGVEEKLKIAGERLNALANRIGVCLDFRVKKLNLNELNREKLGVEPDEALAVNFAFKLHKLPDESVTTENLRDELLRLVKGLSPSIMTVVEQEMNGNTAPLTVRVREACEHYGALFDSLEATVLRENPGRVRIEEALGRRIGNSIACEGRDRVERCEVAGKWRARVSMAGFRSVPMSQTVSESLRVKLNSGTRGNPGFTVNEQSGGICFGWMGRTLTVTSAWR